MGKKAYYNRVMSDELENLLSDKKHEENKNFKWLIDYVKKHEDLDFQTGSNQDDKENVIRSWFSIYKGTARIITLEDDGIPYKIVRDGKRKNKEGKDVWKYKHLPLKNLNKAELDKIKEEWDRDDDKERYYMDKGGNKKEGYYQTLISRHYSLDCKSNDELIILDKEFVIGYQNQEIKDQWLKGIKENNIENWKVEQEKKARQVVEDKKLGRFPKDIGNLGTECDFLAIGKDGSIILLELKRPEDTQKIYLSPLQVGHYGKLTKQFLEVEEYWEDFKQTIKEMYDQKKRLGLINHKWPLPELKKEIQLAVVVGKDFDIESKYPTQIAMKRLEAIRDVVDENITIYTNDKDGKLERIM